MYFVIAMKVLYFCHPETDSINGANEGSYQLCEHNCQLGGNFMRITNNMMISNMINNLQTNIRRLDKTQLQYNTGKRIHKPSDDPVGITRSLKIKADINELKQYKKNVEDAMSWLENTEQAVISNHETLKRLRDLMVQGANGVLTKEEMIKVRNEVAEIKNQVINLANTTYSGDYIFSGKKTNEKLLNQDGSYNVDVMQFLDSGIVDHRINYEVGVGEYIPINTVGTILFEVADLTMSVELPEAGENDATKMEFLGAEVTITKNGDGFELGINIENIGNEDIEIVFPDHFYDNNGELEDGAVLKNEDDIYETISNTFKGIKEKPEQVKAWNELLVKKNIPADINNLTFGTYENNGKAVGIVAKPKKAGLINLIEKIEENLEKGKHEEISDLLGSIDRFLDQSLVVRGEIGAKVNRTELIQNRIEDDIINLRALQSKLEDADLAETAIQLMNEENVYRASLSVGARIIQPTLLDFLR